MAPQASPHFTSVSSQLHLGGPVYLYDDIDGDAERATDFVLSVLRDTPELRRLAAPDRLNAKSLVRILGLEQTRAVGLSSYETDERYRNRGFIHASARVGLLRALGGEPEPFELADIAPEGADLVWEQQLDVGALLEVISELSALGVGMSPAALEQSLDAPLLSFGVTLRSVLEDLKTKIGMVLAVDESRNLWIPGESFTFPYTDFVVQLDGLEELIDAVIRYAASDPFVRATRSEEWVIVTAGIRLPPPWNAYEPALIKEVATGRTYLVSSPAFLKECLATSEGIATKADFQKAMAGLPTEGNGMLYLSPKMTRVMHAALDRIVSKHGPAVQTHVARFLLPDAGQEHGWALQNRPDGILFTSNSASSHKATLLTLGYAALLPAAVLLGSTWLEPEPNPL